ncbi:sigma-54 factor interaction domain-containing protein, partial [Klebsiella pneumoniae]|uniref:sigma-54 factor interaction domain-containing protein n=1 Tax=Klebsiella pneumoniae TaxID=573 RepID=UPI00371DF1F9
GKDVAANALHRWSRRATRSFVAVNCGALPETMIESELFGHEAGAFTGALKKRVGNIEHAHGGTLFLDEINEMPLELQVKLLRVLETGVFMRVGGTEPIQT